MKHVMNWGAILGFVLIALSLAFYLMGLTEASWVQWISYAAIGAVIYVATKARKDNSNGFISYGQGLGTGVGVAFFASILVAFYTYVFFSFIDADMLEEMILRVEDQMYDQGTPADQVEIAMQYTRKFMAPGPMAAMVVLTYTIIGFIISLITSAILKKEDTSFESNFK
jgi:hypothetical protein